MAELSTEPSTDQRAARGKAARANVRRRSHAELSLVDDRDPIALLVEQERSRVAKLLPLRHARMAVSPFTFFRGAAAVMAADLAGTPVSGLHAQLCGDAHVTNFGVFATPERRLVFDLNDFDETYPGPWEWDVKRFATSIEIACRDNGFSRADRRDCVLEGVRAYREAMAEFAAEGNLEVWYAHLDAERALAAYDHELDARERKRGKKALAKARARDSVSALAKLSEPIDGVRQFISDPPRTIPLRDLAPVECETIQRRIAGVIEHYADTLGPGPRHLFGQYRFVELAHKVVGVGSVGTRCWIALFVGRDPDDPLILQIKEAQLSVLQPYVRGPDRHHGERVVTGQRIMQAYGDILLGWTTGIDEHGRPCDYYVRQLHDWKGSFKLSGMSPTAMSLYVRGCGWTLARAHACSGDRVAIAGYLGRGDVFDEAVADYAAAYADVSERDHAAFVAAIQSGRLAASDANPGI
jgi:uncharacterized protein (DUF2252 family)